MRAEPDELEHTIGRLPVDEDKIGLDVAVAVIGPRPGECMIAVGGGQGEIGAQELNQIVEFGWEKIAVLATRFTF